MAARRAQAALAACVIAVTAAASPASAATAPVGAGAVVAVRDAANPVTLRIPSIGVTTRVVPLRLDTEGRLVAPERFDRAGWNQAGPEPGEKGVAVIAGHVDSRTGPAVFYRLRELKRGARIHVDRADGTTVTFTVSGLARYPKNRIPNAKVYGSGKGAQLRLITCGGDFDRKRRSYRDNVVVFAS
ncbi:class F sortase [Nonomuraea sp. SBT364]|uniref:class F sortase n=1 Tax=Nonomuraea sp. SBT364 TaxID=1580530 RepID=UPI00066A7ADA|nr:class F sortase [Nonomuraea sp. SBT364]